MNSIQPDNINKTPIKPWISALLIIPAYFLFVGVFQFFGYLTLGLDVNVENPVKTPSQETIFSFFTLTGTFLLVCIFTKNVDKQDICSVGFYKNRLWTETMTGTALGAFLLVIGFTLLILINKIQWVETKIEPLNFLWGLFLFVSVAISEELLMRGYVLNNLSRSMPKAFALIISSVAFSLMHIFNPNFSWISFWNIFLAGILLGQAYIYTKNLWFPIALHFSWNFFQGTIFGFNVSGIETYSLITQTRLTDKFWNGGQFGFEGSILCIVLQLVAIFGLWLFFNQTKKTNDLKFSSSQYKGEFQHQELKPAHTAEYTNKPN